MKDAANFTFDDSARLARWAANDRGVLKFDSVEEVTSKARALRQLFHYWIETTA